jgi:hypothetical protein
MMEELGQFIQQWKIYILAILGVLTFLMLLERIGWKEMIKVIVGTTIAAIIMYALGFRLVR